LAFLTWTVGAACREAPRKHTETEYRHLVDSAVQEAIPGIQAQFEEDLDRRMSIEMPPLADSLSGN
jgi:hypothetical protein